MTRKPENSARVAFYYSYEPSGHAQAAAALESCGKESFGWETARLNLTSDVHPFLGPMVSRAYLELTQKTPALWDYLYDNQAVAGALQELRHLLSAIHRMKLRARTRELKPDAIVCTHALPCATLSMEKKAGRLDAPIIACITDYGIHAYWLLEPEYVDLFLVPTQEVASELERRGVSAQRIAVTGIPVDPRYARVPSKEEARSSLGLQASEPVLLLAGGSHGLGPLRDIAATLLEKAPRATLFVVCGKNPGLFESLKEKYGSHPRVRLEAYVRNMPELMAAADLLIGKPGGVTSSEAMVVGLPFLAFEPIPGQEERNAKYLSGRGGCLQVQDLEELGARARDLLERPQELQGLRLKAKAVGRPDSARIACEKIQGLLSARHPIFSGSSSVGRAHGSGP